MTENDAKTIDDCLKELKDHRDVYLKRSTPWRIVNRAVRLIEELKQYRAIGTVEGYKRAIEISKENFRVSMEYKAKVQEYEAIGTIEEFKALKDIKQIADNLSEMERIEYKALKEKNEPKKPKKSGVTDNKGVFHVINGINGMPYDLCPNCEINLCTDGMFGGNTKGMKYCKNCGQKLDWSE